MSLLDPIVVCDAVLQTVMQQDVFLAVRTDAPPGGGAGTWDDPYYAANPSLSDTANAALFDGIMNDSTKVPSGTTVHFGPGTFCTTGSDNAGHQGWAARDGLRLIGSGISATKLKLVNVPAGQQRWAIGMPSASPGLQGFEAVDFSVDCNFVSGSAAANSGNGAIGVFGTHVYLRRIKAFNFGSNVTGGYLTVFSFATAGSENCIVSECIADSVVTGNTATVILFGVVNNYAPPHRFCAVRNCSGQGVPFSATPPTVTDLHVGISPGYGLGTVVEGNEISNVGRAVAGLNTVTADLVVRDNYFRNVYKGIDWDQQSGGLVGRIIAVGNTIDLSKSLAHPVGLRFTGNTGAYRFDTLIVRRNVIRQTDDPGAPLSDASGIYVAQAKNAIVDNNVINDTTNNSTTHNAVSFSNTVATTFFNNRDSSGLLLNGFDAPNQTLHLALEDAVSMIPLVVASRGGASFK